MERVSSYAVVLALLLAGLGAALGANETDLAPGLVEQARISRGICVVLGIEDTDLPIDLVRSSGFLVHALDPSTATVAIAREKADVDGLYLKRVLVETGPLDRLPHANNTVDLVVASALTTDSLPQYAPAAILSALRPGGVALLGNPSENVISPREMKKWLEEDGIDAEACKALPGSWVSFTKPYPEGMDEWTHWQRRPDNNPVSTDAVIRAPYRTQWLAKPYYIAMPSVTTAAGGRVFTAMGHIAHHKREEPWLDTLLARNGYNGQTLWERKLPMGFMAHRSAFVATKDVFYLMDGHTCAMLDPETGHEIGRIRIPELNDELKWMAIEDGVLYVLADAQADPYEAEVVRDDTSHWGWSRIGKGYYEDRIPWGFGHTLAAYDMEKERVLWRYEEDAPIDSRALLLGGGNLYFYCPDKHLGAMDAKSGNMLWLEAASEPRGLIEEPGEGLTRTPGFKTSPFALYTPDALVYAGQTRMNVVAVSPKDGKLLWHKKKFTNNPNAIYADGLVYVGIGDKNGQTVGLDPLTGEEKAQLGFAKTGCVRLTGTPDAFFCRGFPDGFQRYERERKRMVYNGAMRPGCTDGVIGANGMLYVGPWLCDCNLLLMGMGGLTSAGNFDVTAEDPVEERLEVAFGADNTLASLNVTPEDWPQYRGNIDRTACSLAKVSGEPAMRWQKQAETEFTPTAPTAAGGLVFLGGSDGKVRAYDAGSGELRWAFQTAGPVAQPPSIWENRAYFGSGDGHAYCVEAATGALLWRFRVAPVERRIMLYGALCSAWPVNSGVLVKDGVAYLAAGVVDYDGTYVYALDAKSGKVKWKNMTCGHVNKEARKGVSAQGALTIVGDWLVMAGGNVINPAVFALDTGELVVDHPTPGGAFPYFGEEVARFSGDLLLLGGGTHYSAVDNNVNGGLFRIAQVTPDGRANKDVLIADGKIPPAWNGEMLVTANGPYEKVACLATDALQTFFAEQKGTDHVFWQQRREGDFRKLPKRWEAGHINGDTVAFALAGNTVVLAYEQYQPRWQKQPWYVCGLDAQTGALKWSKKLPSGALPGGLLVDREGQVIVALENGGLVCVG